MPIIDWPVGTMLIALAALTATLLWLFRDKRYPGPRLEHDEPAIDRARLEAAEREVRELDPSEHPDKAILGDHWSPGTPRPPERL